MVCFDDSKRQCRFSFGIFHQPPLELHLKLFFTAQSFMLWSPCTSLGCLQVLPRCRHGNIRPGATWTDGATVLVEIASLLENQSLLFPGTCLYSSNILLFVKERKTFFFHFSVLFLVPKHQGQWVFVAHAPLPQPGQGS